MLVEELGADVNFVSDVGETAMHAAAYRGANSVVRYLYEKGAKLLAVDIDAALLPADNAAYGFDNNADALTLSPALTERYLGASRPGQSNGAGTATRHPDTGDVLRSDRS